MDPSPHPTKQSSLRGDPKSAGPRREVPLEKQKPVPFHWQKDPRLAADARDDAGRTGQAHWTDTQRVCAMEIGRQDFTISMLVKLCRNLYVGLAELVDRPELF